MTYQEVLCELEERGLHINDIVVHFKRENVEYPKNFSYLYRIKGLVQHTETGEVLVEYVSLYDNNIPYVRPLDMFLSEVDHEKYPEIKQKYRLEKYEYKEDEFGIIEGAKSINELLELADKITKEELKGEY